MNHPQMAEMTYLYLNKAQIDGTEAENLVECKRWLQAIGSGQLHVEDQQGVQLGEDGAVHLKEDGSVPMTDGNGEYASPDGPEGDAAPG